MSLFVNMLLVGTTSYSFGLFVKPFSAAFHLGRADTNLGLVLFQAGTAVFSPLIGMLADRYPSRLIFLASGLLVGGGLVVVGLSTSLPLTAAMMAIPIPLGASGGLLAGVVLICRWFDRQRGRAFAISALGTSLAGFVVFPLVAVAVSQFGWRDAVMIVGGSIILLISILCLLVRERLAADVENDPAAAPSPAEPLATLPEVRVWRVTELLRNREFWLIATATALMLGVDGALLATTTPYGLDRGLPLAQVSLLMIALSASAIGGKLIIAWLADRVSLIGLTALTGCFGVLLSLVLLVDASYPVLLLACAITGLAIGGTYPLSNALVARLFGASSVGTARGLMTPLTSLLSGIGLYGIGAVHDLYGSYAIGLAVFAGASAIAVVLVLCLNDPDSTSARPTEREPASARG